MLKGHWGALSLISRVAGKVEQESQKELKKIITSEDWFPVALKNEGFL